MQCNAMGGEARKGKAMQAMQSKVIAMQVMQVIQGNTRQCKAMQVMHVMQGIPSGAEGNARGWIRFQENSSTEVYSIKYDCKYKGTINYKYKYDAP